MKRLVQTIGALICVLLGAPGWADGDTAPRPEQAPADGEARARIERALSSLAGEPSLRELERAALRLADADAEGADGWMGSANWSAVLPVVKVVAEHDLERDESLDRYQDEPDRWGADTDRDLGFQVSAQWNLPELVFNPDEVRIYGALANRATRREALLTTLVGYYFERRRQQLAELLEPAPDLARELERRMRIEELTAVIDALTGGLLTRTLEKD
ncbi:MAG: hypothetical protein JRF63_01805 [Deltaproteobacteria bacterium]|nr:hypothetical protein [Deltaproteobacteria bacterium]